MLPLQAQLSGEAVYIYSQALIVLVTSSWSFVYAQHNAMSTSTSPSVVEGRLSMPELYMTESDARGYQFWNNLLFVCVGVSGIIYAE